MTFRHIPTKIPKVVQVNTPNGRYYQTPNGSKLYSITTILSATKDMSGINDWRKRVGEDVANYITNESTKVGSATHKLVENYLNNQKASSNSLYADAHFRNLMPYLLNINNIRGLELALYSENHSMAGTADCIAEYNGVLSVIDFKTSRYRKPDDWIDSYRLQATAYCIMWQERTKIPIDQFAILLSNADNTSDEVIGKVSDYKPQLFNTLEEFRALPLVMTTSRSK